MCAPYLTPPSHVPIRTVLAAVIIMGDRLGLLNSLGLLIVILGVLLYNWHKYQRMRSGQIVGNHHIVSNTRLISHQDSASKRDDDTAGYSALEMEPLDCLDNCRVNSNGSLNRPIARTVGSVPIGLGGSDGGGGFVNTSASVGDIKEGLWVSPPLYQQQASPVGIAPSSPGIPRVRGMFAGSASNDGSSVGVIPRNVGSPSFTNATGFMESRRSSSSVDNPLVSSGGSGRHSHTTLAYTPDLADGVGEGSDMHQHHSHHTI